MFAMTPAEYVEYAELGEALQTRPVPANLTRIRREYSGETYQRHGRTTVRLAPAKAAANRANRRSTREALSRVVNGGDIAVVTRQARKHRTFQYEPGIDHRAQRLYDEAMERRRRWVLFWKKYDAWKAQVKEIETIRGYWAAKNWVENNPEPLAPF